MGETTQGEVWDLVVWMGPMFIAGVEEVVCKRAKPAKVVNRERDHCYVGGVNGVDDGLSRYSP